MVNDGFRGKSHSQILWSGLTVLPAELHLSCGLVSDMIPMRFGSGGLPTFFLAAQPFNNSHAAKSSKFCKVATFGFMKTWTP
jgi:hypothetical protein